MRNRGHRRYPSGPQAHRRPVQGNANLRRQAPHRSCTLTGWEDYYCPYPDGPRWCGITMALPTSVTAAYSAYGSAASSWVAAHSDDMLRLAEDCPLAWYQGINWQLQGYWLNTTIVMAECYESLKITGLAGGGAAATTTGAGMPRPTPGSGATTAPPPVRTTAATNHAAHGVMGEVEKAGLWAVIGGGVAAVAAGGMRH